jgi:hypothetical protein
MTPAEAWVRFAAAALGEYDTMLSHALAADELLAEYLKRFPPDPIRKPQLIRAPRPARAEDVARVSKRLGRKGEGT